MKCSGFVENLEVLDLAFNQIATLPDELQALRNLATLDITGNHLSQFPEWIWGLPLVEIQAESNRLNDVTLATEYEGQLVSLVLSENLISNIDERVLAIGSLEHLNLRGNSLEALPDIPLGSSLQNLDVGDNRLSTLPDLRGGASLRTLSCDSNNLLSLPDYLPPELRYLNAADNRIEVLPDTPEYFEQLQFLDLSLNKLTTLPLAITQMDPSAELMVFENPLSRTMLTAAEQGITAIFAYLKSLTEQTRPCREAKLVLIGEGNVGKSSLVAALAGEPFVEDRPTTHGIEIRELDFADPAGAPLRLNTWDFGGQEIYRVTHQFYLSQDSVMAVVWRPREGLEQGGVAFWLDRVRRLVGDRGAVLLVSTYADEGRQTHLNFEDLQFRYYPLIKSWLRVDNKSGTGIEELRQHIILEALKLDHIEDPLAESWIALRHRLAAIDRPFISRKEYDELATEFGLGPSAASTWLRLLHALGQVIYFEHDVELGNLIIIDPELLARAVSYVLEDQGIVAANGVVSHVHLAEIWSTNLTDVKDGHAIFPYLLRLMEKNDISYRFLDSDLSLIAPVVTNDRPLDLVWEPGTPLEKDEKELTAQCSFNCEPIGLVPWLIVRANRWSTATVWDKGVFVSSKAGEASAIAELVSERTLQITVRGRYPNELFSVLRSEVEFLATRWPDSEVDITIPCPKCVANRARRVGRFRAASLLRAAASSVGTLQCGECFDHIAVLDLLAGFEVRSLDPAGDRFAGLEARVAEFQEKTELGLRDIKLGQDSAAVIGAQLTENVREMRRVMSMVAADCPRLFSVAPVDLARYKPARYWRSFFALQLWCEEPGECHPVGGSYSFTRQKEWFQRAAPLIRTMHRLLKVVPIVAKALPEVVSDADWREVEAHLESMAGLVEAIDADEGDEPNSQSVEVLTSGGFELRVMKELLLELDPLHEFRRMNQVFGVGGEALWVCGEHYPRYDPGLPVVAVSSEQARS